MTVLENVALPAVIAGRKRKTAESRARDLLDLLGHGRQGGTPCPACCRVDSANGWPSPGRLANEPTLLLADEPTGALDSEGGQEVIELLCRLHPGGQTIVLVTHDAGVASAAERIVRMRDGRIAVDEESEIPVGRRAVRPRTHVGARRGAGRREVGPPPWRRRRCRAPDSIQARPGRPLRIDGRSHRRRLADHGPGGIAPAGSVALGLALAWALVGLVDAKLGGAVRSKASPFHSSGGGRCPGCGRRTGGRLTGRDAHAAGSAGTSPRSAALMVTAISFHFLLALPDGRLHDLVRRVMAGGVHRGRRRRARVRGGPRGR